MLEPPMEDKNNSISHGERIILGGLILLFVVKGIERLWSWIQSPRHFYLSGGAFASSPYSCWQNTLGERLRRNVKKHYLKKQSLLKLMTPFFVELLITEKISGLNHDKGLCTHKSSGRLMLVKLKV
jgi:hypothetical protein